MESYELINLEEKVDELLNIYTLEEILEHNDITHEELITILYNLGYITFPSFMMKELKDYDDYH